MSGVPPMPHDYLPRAAPTAPAAAGPKISSGRQVHYVMREKLEGDAAHKHRPATIVEARDCAGKPSEPGKSAVNLAVLLDGDNDRGRDPGVTDQHGRLQQPMWVTSACYGPDNTPGTWHWPEQV